MVVSKTLLAILSNDCGAKKKVIFTQMSGPAKNKAVIVWYKYFSNSHCVGCKNRQLFVSQTLYQKVIITHVFY